MTDSYVQERIKEIYDAYEQNGRTKDYTITITPINGSGDVYVNLIKGIRIADKLINTEVRKEIIIKEGDNLDFIKKE